MERPNALQWDGRAGHYEVWYLTLTDAATGTGLWIRYTMLAPANGGAGGRAARAGGGAGGRAARAGGGAGGRAAPANRGAGECALWLVAMGPGGRLARKASFPLAELHARDDPFHVTLAGADLSDRGMAGAFEDVAWELSWEPGAAPAEHVHPLLRRARIAKTVLVLPHPDLAVSGTVRLGDRELALDGARGGQAHLWGSKHAGRWAWAHCNDLATLDGAPRPGAYLDGVSVVVPRLGRDIGPSTPVVGHLLGEDFRATSPARVVRAPSRFGLTGWRFEATDGRRRVECEVEAPRESLVGVTYRDPDGERAWCYNSEVASMRAVVWDRTARGRSGWTPRETLVADGRAHFEYAQREPVAGVDVLVPA
jgi:hypothetical protein